VTKPIEDELSSISGINRLTSENREGFSFVVAEFNLEVDVKHAEQQVRDRVGTVRAKLPHDVRDSTIMRLDPADQPIIVIGLKADLPPAKLYDLADDKLVPMLEQVPSIGKVEIVGGRKREIHVALDRKKLKQHELSATMVAARLHGTGQNIPGGKKEEGTQDTTFRTLGEFNQLKDISSFVVNFFANEVPVRISDIAEVKDTLADERSRTYLNGAPMLTITTYKQSGTNTVKVADAIKTRISKINAEIAAFPGHPQLTVIRDGAHVIRLNVEDVKESILIGIALAVLVVFLFLGNFRSTIITGLALPNSLLGAFILMWMAGYTINIMSLLALTLSVGLLVDDAIVVRENIFRHLEMGKNAVRAAIDGTGEVRLAVIATTLTIVAVFAPLGFLSGIVGQFFKQFGLTVVFAMLISLFDALTIAPMLSAYFAGRAHQVPTRLYRYSFGIFLGAFGKLQDGLEILYEKILRVIVRVPLVAIVVSVAIFFGCMSLIGRIPKTFVPAADAGEFIVGLDLPPGTSLDGMAEVAHKVDEIIRRNKEVTVSSLTVGSTTGDSNQANFYVGLVPATERLLATSEVKAHLREQLKAYAHANPIVADYNPFGNQRMFMLNILGSEQKTLERIALQVKEHLSKHQALVDVDVNFRPGKPEFQVLPKKNKLQQFGISAANIGNELRAQIEGLTPAKFREEGLEYDIRVRLQDSQRNLKNSFAETYVPNLNNFLLPLAAVADPFSTTGPSKITRQDRSKYVQINADVRPGFGLGDVMADSSRLLQEEMKLPAGYSFKFIGQGENFQELGQNMAIAMGVGVLVIFLVLASLYESFVTPLTIMLAMPLAICGSIFALAVTHESLNVFSMIGLVMLLGVAVKNSILLVDYALQQMALGLSRNEAIIAAGKIRLRPILMTSMALIAGTLPLAMGLNEVSRQRTSMGIAIVGGLISSTFLTLLLVPAVFSFVDRLREGIKNLLGRIFIVDYERRS
jgi:HAE1 family hydrophobic/amphiphilic exporter-1